MSTVTSEYGGMQEVVKMLQLRPRDPNSDTGRFLIPTLYNSLYGRRKFVKNKEKHMFVKIFTGIKIKF